jgi:hypothetical protein
MTVRFPVALAAACLVAAPAGADVVQANSTTVVTGGELWRQGDAKAAVPVYELVSVSASEMKNGWGEFEAVLSAWGAVDAGPIRFWQNGAPSGSRASGDVDVGYLRGDLFSRRLTFRLGRQVVIEGTARMLQIDGGQVVLRLPAGFGLSGYAGAPVYPRFDARGTELATGSTAGDVAYGGRISWERAGLLSLGLSAAMADSGSEATRREVGADFRLVPVHALELAGSGFYATDEKRIGQADVAANIRATRTVTIVADYQHVEPDLFLARNSILAVFAAEKRNDAGGGVRWTPLRAVVVDADYHFLKAPDGNGGRARLKGSFRPYDQGVVGADLQLLKVPDNGYWQARAFCSRQWGRYSGTLDLWIYRYDKKVNEQSQSVGGTATGGWQVAPSWKVLLAATAGSDPFFKSRLDVMAKLAWTQTYVREVR